MIHVATPYRGPHLFSREDDQIYSKRFHRCFVLDEILMLTLSTQFIFIILMTRANVSIACVEFYPTEGNQMLELVIEAKRPRNKHVNFLL